MTRVVILREKKEIAKSVLKNLKTWLDYNLLTVNIENRNTLAVNVTDISNFDSTPKIVTVIETVTVKTEHDYDY